MLVLCDRRVRDALLVRIEDSAGQGDAFGVHLNPPVRHLIDIYVLADETTRKIVYFEPDALAVVL